MSFATTIPLLLGLVIWAGILALVIYLAVLLIKALRKYLKSGPVRQEKAEMARSLGEAIRYHRTRCKMTQEFVAESLGVSRQAVSKWESGTADPSTSNLLAWNDPKNCDRLPRPGQAIFFIGLIKRRSGRSVPAASPC